ncbi:hypothetical protein HMPREF1214_03705 [Bacteroides sp. HPS0048]|uniref:hypothetical protein n=1 Tax=Bacteroides sp. HPS0048 TaxID=1078089 RepID=UPI00037D2D4A|nr:hypothetical protein [Bacteroides sp. HPS0048]EOA55582.1 hypothetical protein HMPREF1214_03705 [Bacteroides sp. HPS0048]
MDIITRLLLKTNDFDANLNKAKGSVNGFQGGIANMAKTAGAGVMKFAGAIGLAVGATEAFGKVMSSSQTLGDEYARTMDGLKGGVDQFFYSIGSGDWTPFMSGLAETIRLARDAYDAMDQLGNTRMSFSYFDSKNQATVQEQITILKDKDSTEEQKQAARELLDKTLKDQEEIVGQYRRRSNNAVQAMVKAAIGIDGVDVSMIDIDKALRLDVSAMGDSQKEELSNQYKEFEREYDKLKDKFTRMEAAGVGENMFVTSVTDKNALSKAMAPVIAKYQDAIKYNAILVKKNDEWLQELAGVVSAAENAYRNLQSMTKAANRASQSNAGGGVKPPYIPKESLGWFDSEIAKKNKELIKATTMQAKAAVKATIKELESQKIDKLLTSPDVSLSNLSDEISKLNKTLINETDMQARVAVQKTIDQLEQRKVNIKVIIERHIFEIDHRKGKEPDLKKAGFNYKETKDLLPKTIGPPKGFGKIESPIKKKDIALNEKYNESLSAMGSIMGNLSGAFDGNTASVLQWGSTLLTTIAQAIPAITGMIPVKKANTEASKEEATASMLSAGAQTMEAHASIPFAGIAIGLAGVASIIAVLASMPKFTTGGIVPGVSFTGDKVPALLNSGEMILNSGQQSNLFKLLSGNIYGGLDTGKGISHPQYNSLTNVIMQDEQEREIKVTGNFRVRGCDLELAIKNQNSKKSKVR